MQEKEWMNGRPKGMGKIERVMPSSERYKSVLVLKFKGTIQGKRAVNKTQTNFFSK